MVALEKATEQPKITCIIILLMEFQHTYSNQCAIHQCSHSINMMPLQRTTRLPHNAHFNDILTEYPEWSTDTNDIENTNEAQYRSSRQDILTAWQKDTPVKMPDNRQVSDNLEAYVRDKLNITKSLHDKLGLTESSLLGVQLVTVAMVQSDQLTTNITNNSSNSTEIGQPDDYDYQDDMEEYLYQVDGTMDICSPTDHSTYDEDTEPDNNTH